MELAPRPLRPAARGRDRQRTRRTTSEGQFRARIRASSNLAESFLSHDLSPSPSPNPPPPHISRLIVIAVIVVVVVSRGGRSFSPSQTRTTMQSVRDKSYFVLRVPLPAPPVIVAMDIYIFFLPFLSFSVSPPSTDNPSVTSEERAQPRKSRGALRENAFLIQLVTSSRRMVSSHLAIFSFFFFFFLGSCDYFVSEREISRDDRTGSMASFSDTEIVPSSAD